MATAVASRFGRRKADDHDSNDDDDDDDHDDVGREAL